MGPLPAPQPRRNGHITVSLEETYLLTRQLAVLQKSGVPLLSSLQALEEQLASPALARILRGVNGDLQEGKTLSQALARHPGAFGPVYLGLVRVGEAGGLLDETLAQLARLFEWEIEVRNRMREALQYPLIVLLTLGIAIVVTAIFVLPRFAEMFRSFHITLPLQTRLLIGLSQLLSQYGWLLLLGVLGTGFAWWSYIRTDAGRLRWHGWQLRLPVLGPVFLELAMSRFARVTAALVRSGVPMLETLALAEESVPNRRVRLAIEAVRGRIRSGEPLSQAMRAAALFPPVVIQMVATGEETGRMDELLHSVSDYYDQQTAYVVKRLITCIEPVLLIVVGLGVLVMASAVLMPMWDLVQVFKQGR